MKIPHISRFSFLGIALGVIGLFIVLQMARIQTSPSAKALLKDSAEKWEWYDLTLTPARGSIYDRWGHLLAGNEEVYEVGIDLRVEPRDATTIAMTASTLLGVDYNIALGLASTKLGENGALYRRLVDFVPKDKIDKLEKMQKDFADAASTRRNSKNSPSLDGVVWTPHLKRSYPEGKLGSTLIGFYPYKEADNAKGYFGLEEKYNDLLTGPTKTIRVSTDPHLASQQEEIPPGDSLVLTIDREIQASVENILDVAVEKSGSDSGTVIVMDPVTGEILAMATTPRMDPNEYWTYSSVFPNPTPYNRAVSMTYEPGSVFKVLTMASALDAGVVTPDTTFNDVGVYVASGAYIYNWDGAGHGTVTMTNCMMKSLNVCLAWLAVDKLGPTKFYDYIRSFGIGHLTGVDLAGEAYFPLRLPGDETWYSVDLATNAFGQGISATPIEMITAISSIANKQGKMMAPHLVKAIIKDGRQYPINPLVVGTPIKAETAQTLTNMLAISIEGEAQTPPVPGYRIAGKTGTAEIPSPTGYSSDLTNASFVGWGPVADPKFLVYVWLEKPRTSKWGSVVAAPVFFDVVKSLAVYMNIPPDGTQLEVKAGDSQPN